MGDGLARTMTRVPLALAGCWRPHRIKRFVGYSLLAAAPLLEAQDFVEAPATDPVQTYLEAIEQAEALGGTYAGELVDLYYGMGQSLSELGELEEARNAFHQAVLVSRVNSGPNGLEQTNYLYGIADIEFRIGNPKGAVGALEQIYRIHTRHHGEDSPDMLPVLKQLSGWYTERLARSGERARPSDFENLSFLAERIAYLTEARYGLGSPRSAKSSRALAQAHYRAIYQVVVTGHFPEPSLVMNTGPGGQSVGPEPSILNHYQAGEAALQRAVQSWQENPDASELQVAEAVAQVGDWNLAFEHHRAAQRNYEQAYQVLAASADFAPLAERYLGQPTPIRIMQTSGSMVRNLEPPSAEGSLDISMTVKSTGRLRDIRIINAPAGLPEEQLLEVRQILEGALFRPAVIGGEVRTLEGFVWRVPALRENAAPAPSPG